MRDKLLDAAAELILSRGAQSLTLDAVAAEAGVSKGGLLYHFPSKKALVAGMMDRLVGEFDRALDEAGDQPGAVLRAYLDATVGPDPAACGEAGDRVTAAALAAMLVDPDGLAPLRERYREWQRRVVDGPIDQDLATLVRLTVDGWWIARLLDLAPPADDSHHRIRQLLHGLIDQAASSPAGES